MARLNEHPAPTETNLEILRRKFLRQNRDIARINSDQSQKIRRLENDCARLLSENLDLRGQILRLEKQIEDNSARRIADHALEVKAKLEEQLSEFAALLGSLGVEPPTKRRASGEWIMAKSRQSMAKGPPQRKRGVTAADAEALAEQEGRLPPIYENKTYPRATMNSEEIMALCAAAADTSDSPDLGPPPVSRYIDEDAVRDDSPAATVIPESPKRSPTILSPPKLDYDRKVSQSPEPMKVSEETVVKESTPSKTLLSPRLPVLEPPTQPIRAGSKRKYGDENGAIHTAVVQPGKENAMVTEKPFTARGGPRRSIKELPSNRRERGSGRAPLAAKSTNEDMSSPRKQTTAVPLKEAKEQAQGTEHSTKGRVSAQKSLPKMEVFAPAPEPEPPATVAVMLESVTALPSGMPSSPSTPERASRKEMPHDTPPPADISSNGETSRPSRRARPAISYAEPNLRDKMRRPTKELFDAVTGEGKFVHRAIVNPKSDDNHSAPTSSSKVQSQSKSSTSSSNKSFSAGGPIPKAQQHSLLSPLAQKDVFPETLPSTVVTERRKRPSGAGGNIRESSAVGERPEGISTLPSPTIMAQSQTTAQSGSGKQKGITTLSDTDAIVDNGNQVQTVSAEPEVDIYDFAASSPASTTKETPETNNEAAKPVAPHSSSRSRTTRKSSMAAAAALRELLDGEEEEAKLARTAPKSRSSHARKRVSMLAPKKSSMMDSLEDAVEEVANTSGSSTGSQETEAEATRDRISRRRSMML
ncbi:uncharacterized protein B0T15DRAFT_485965 [Chaetomium strumarium]|uniref:Shugoshin n=1 Tax=Chaetomium strumarium TaxID=1170767 RepID=A0AAJ0GQI6_9PEZI|nr:hypothetical protein B0T15DRAFT_485965 [Chaetomium strumarium]